MSRQQLTERFKGRLPLIQVVLDGWGLGREDETNAIFRANTPLMDKLQREFPTTQLFAHGTHVGLPSENDLGGSEVGHLTLGAGCIYEQGPTYINRLIESGELFESPALVKLVKNCLDHQTPLHLIGLLSDGYIHSHIDHFEALIKHAFKVGIKQCYVHPLLDGRDVPIQSAEKYTDQLEELFAELKSQRPEIDYAFASGGGRETITMDRDNDWDKVEAGWNAHVRGKAGDYFGTITEAINTFRERQPDIIDQALPAFVLVRDGQPIGPIRDNHSVIFVNYRADRATEFTQAMVLDDFDGFDRSPRPNVQYAGLMIYDQDNQLPPDYIVGPTKVDNPFGRRILEQNLNQFRLTETQKFAHVTFFYNGGYREPLDAKKEEYYLINSDRIPSFDLKPEMKAYEISQKAVEFILNGQFQYGLINFANTDMVGHSGSMEAAIKAAETVDKALGPIVEAVKKMNGVLIITADHGNADEMLSFNKKKNNWELNTKHSLNPVPFILYDPLFKPGDYQLKSAKEHNLTLANVAATNFMLLGRDVPSDLDEPLFVV